MEQDYFCAYARWTLGGLGIALALISATLSTPQAQAQAQAQAQGGSMSPNQMSPSPQVSAQARATARIVAAGDTRGVEQPAQFKIQKNKHKYLMRRRVRTATGQIRVDFE
jgi:hypothetical protein